MDTKVFKGIYFYGEHLPKYRDEDLDYLVESVKDKPEAEWGFFNTSPSHTKYSVVVASMLSGYSYDLSWSKKPIPNIGDIIYISDSDTKVRVTDICGTYYPHIETTGECLSIKDIGRFKILGNGLSFSHRFENFLNQTELGKALLNVVSKGDIDYLDFSIEKPGMVGYIIKDRLDRFNGKVYDKELRVKYAHMCKSGKLVKRLLPKIGLSDVELFSSKIRAAAIIMAGDGFVEGTDIKESYLSSNYFSYLGTLGNSCMQHARCQDYMELYERNGVRILTLIRENLVAGRALLWDNVKFVGIDEVKTFMDRVYTNNSQDEELFLQYARDHGYVFKAEQNYANKMDFIKYENGEDVSFYSKITYGISYFNEDNCPYVDTLSYTNQDRDTLTNIEDDCRYELLTTDGYADPRSDCYSEYLERYIDDDDCCWSERLNSNLEAYNCVSVRLDNGDWDYMPKNHYEITEVDDCWYFTDSEYIVFSNYNNKYILLDDAIYVDRDDDYYYNEQVQYCGSIDEYVFEDETVEMTDGTYMPADADNIVKIDDNWHFIDSNEIEYIGDKYVLINRCNECE